MSLTIQPLKRCKVAKKSILSIKKNINNHTPVSGTDADLVSLRCSPSCSRPVPAPLLNLGQHNIELVMSTQGKSRGEPTFSGYMEHAVYFKSPTWFPVTIRHVTKETGTTDPFSC